MQGCKGKSASFADSVEWQGEKNLSCNGWSGIIGTVIITVGASQTGQVSSNKRRAFAVRSTAPFIVVLVPIICQLTIAG